MALTSLFFAPPIRRLTEPTELDYDLLETAAGLADDGQAEAAVRQVFAHLFPGAEVGDLTSAPFTFVQGSSRVTAQLADGYLTITVPLVTLTAEGNPVAALRYLLTAISGSGQLYQPRLRGDDVHLEFRDKLSRMHPAKVLEVLRRMPVEADRCDDWLIGQFGARALGRAEIEAITDDEAARAEALWRRHWDEIDELVRESQRKRSKFFLNEVTALALFRLQFALPLCGFLGARLSESAATWNDGNQDPSKREAALTRTIKEMRAVTAAELRANLGHAGYALSPLSTGEPTTLRGYFGSGDYIDAIDKYRTSGKSFEAALALTASTTYLLARYAWPTAVAQALMAVLAAADGKPWRDAATVLWEGLKAVTEEFGAEDDGDSTGPDEGGAIDQTVDDSDPTDETDDDDDDREPTP
ncbi:MAG: hypothetical protein KBG48_21250 [Kofleriaceae bacterium]|jgi:hypothetical protein|nr:hypothetical protein [Kofleriaceae bacterium]MBP9858351.1 hypothetical protein [Kofleriaceae bacterium]